MQKSVLGGKNTRNEFVNTFHQTAEEGLLWVYILPVIPREDLPTTNYAEPTVTHLAQKLFVVITKP